VRGIATLRADEAAGMREEDGGCGFSVRVQGSGEAGPFPSTHSFVRVRDDNNGALRDDNNEAGWADFWMMTARRLGWAGRADR